MTSENDTLSAAAAALEETKIKAYLQANPNFFENHPDLLELIRLPHASGGAVSLIERQISVLRDRNMEMRHRLSNMLDSAKANDKLFEKTKRLVLTLLEAGDLPSIVDCLYDSLGTDYQLDFYSLTLLGDPQRISASGAKVVGIDQAQAQIGTLLRSNRAICGVLGRDELEFLFGESANQVGSIAAVPLSHGNTFGILAIGNADPNYYRSSMGTLFLSYIADVLNRIVPKLLT